jgi:fibronectin-binding autotransporter adhesin
LVVGDGGTNGSIVGRVVDNFNLVFNRSDNITFTGNVSGTGILSQNGIGTLTLTGANTYTGGTNIFAGTAVAGVNDALGTGLVKLFTSTLTIPVNVTLHNEVLFVTGGLLDNSGALFGNVTDGESAPERVINSGTINGQVALVGPENIVQLFTGSKITGNLTLAADDNNSMLILDGAGQQLLSQAVLGTITNNGFLVKQGTGTWTVDRPLSAPLGTDILAGTLIVAEAPDHRAREHYS